MKTADGADVCGRVKEDSRGASPVRIFETLPSLSPARADVKDWEVSQQGLVPAGLIGSGNGRSKVGEDGRGGDLAGQAQMQREEGGRESREASGRSVKGSPGEQVMVTVERGTEESRLTPAPASLLVSSWRGGSSSNPQPQAARGSLHAGASEDAVVVSEEDMRRNRADIRRLLTVCVCAYEHALPCMCVRACVRACVLVCICSCENGRGRERRKVVFGGERAGGKDSANLRGIMCAYNTSCRPHPLLC